MKRLSTKELLRRKMATDSAKLYRFAKHTPDLPDWVRAEVRDSARKAAIMARELRS